MRSYWIKAIVILAAAAAAYGVYYVVVQFRGPRTDIATARVEQGEVVVKSFARGELRAVRSVTLVAPNLFGTIQVTRLAPLGSLARAKDLVVEFDDSEVRARLEEKQLELEQIDEQIKKGEADLAVSANQDQVDLLSTRFDVRRAELEVGRNELLAAIDAKENLLTLDESRRKLTQLENDIKSRQAQAQAQLAVLRANREESTLELQREQQRLSQVKLLAPMNGLVSIRQNRTGFFFPGVEIPDIREGDQLQPGIPVADILDLSELDVFARIGELDRANLHVGQDAIVTLDALPGKPIRAHIKSMSGEASSDPFALDPEKKFDVSFSVDMNELLHATGAKPETIAKILAASSENTRRPAPALTPAMAAARNNGARGFARAGAGSGPNLAQMLGPGAVMQQFSASDLANAKLPPPPGDDANVNVLLRPGLLADIQITIEKFPNAIHIPAQAVFEKEGRRVVYVKTSSGFEPRPVKILKRSESVLVISEGLKPGEIVALSDPTAKPDSGNSAQKKTGGALGALPGGNQ